MSNIYNRMYRQRTAYYRTIGLMLIQEIENGATAEDLRIVTGPIAENGLVKGTDMCPISLISFSGASRARRAKAMKAFHSACPPTACFFLASAFRRLMRPSCTRCGWTRLKAGARAEAAPRQG